MTATAFSGSVISGFEPGLPRSIYSVSHIPVPEAMAEATARDVPVGENAITYNFSVFQVVGAGIQSDYIFFHGVIRQFVVGNDDIGIGGSFRFEYLYFYFILRNQPEAFYSPFITDVSQLTQDNGGGAGVGFINSHVQFFHGRFAEFPVR